MKLSNKAFKLTTIASAASCLVYSAIIVAQDAAYGHKN